MECMSARERESTSPSDEEEEEKVENNLFFVVAEIGILNSGRSFVQNSHGFLETF